jgi:hypothetical protein
VHLESHQLEVKKEQEAKLVTRGGKVILGLQVLKASEGSVVSQDQGASLGQMVCLDLQEILVLLVHLEIVEVLEPEGRGEPEEPQVSGD